MFSYNSVILKNGIIPMNRTSIGNIHFSSDPIISINMKLYRYKRLSIVALILKAKQ